MSMSSLVNNKQDLKCSWLRHACKAVLFRQLSAIQAVHAVTQKINVHILINLNEHFKITKK